MERHADETTAQTTAFPSDVAGLPAIQPSAVVEVEDGQALELQIAPVTKRFGDAVVRMLAYNGSVPGPVIKVRQGSEILVTMVNHGDLEATVHWHGLRLDNRFDGTHETQDPVQVGERFEYRLAFPDAGTYWYHPHIRQDYGQEMGLYGNILVAPADPEYWPPAHRDVLLTLDDVLIEEGRIAPFDPQETTHSAMGRFGNVLLVAGEPDLQLTATSGEVVRLHLTNTANTRVFRVKLPGARMKLVGGDSGRVEHEQFVEDVVLAPSERVIVDVLFDRPGELALEHHTPDRVYRLAAVTVGQEAAEPSLREQFEQLRIDPELRAERERLTRLVGAEPDKMLAFVAEMEFDEPEGPVVYVCPMHPDVVQDEPGRCPDCGMMLLAQAVATTYTCPMHPEVVSEEPGRCPQCGMKLMAAPLAAEGVASHEHHGHEGHAPDHHEHGDHGTDGIEWEDDMVEINKITTPANTRWKLVDRSTGEENAGIAWRFRVGDRVMIRLVNEMDSDHPMHHPFHVHGAGRFLILARDGEIEPNLVWKDTVLVRTGEVVDILLDVTHAGRWMAHCHIAEHHESGMRFSFDVAPAEQASA
jgi:FtsP/CotA-like multicopper oxidase with cupredoxin domain